MNPFQEAVRDFHRVMEVPAPERATLEGYRFKLRVSLILEEALEFANAARVDVTASLGDRDRDSEICIDAIDDLHLHRNGGTPDFPAMVDALCDILYVTVGAAIEMGVDIQPFFDLVHAANLAKASGPVREDGKRLKPPGWMPPDIAGLLEQIRAAEARRSAR